MLAIPLLAAFAIASGPPPAASLRQPAPVALRVDGVVQPDGSLGAGGWIVVRNGRIESLGGAAPPAGAATFEFPGGIACAGMVDVATSLGAAGQLAEPARAFTPEVAAADAFEPDHSSFLAAARSGVTTVALTPSGDNIVGGRLALLRTRDDHGRGAVLVGPGPLRFTWSDEAFPGDRVPTSRMGALPRLRELLAQDATKTAGASLVAVQTPDQIRTALDAFSAAGRSIALLQPIHPEEALDLLPGRAQAVALGAYDLDTPERETRLPKLLAERAVPVAFTANGDGAALRLTAALAVRSGLDAKAARLALTAVPARLLGADGDAGTLEAGKRADLVVYGGDPLDLAAKIQLVLVGGAAVAKKETP